jgi:PAS domain S-box-containing protein
MIGIAVWSLGEALDYAAVSLSLKILFAKFEAAGYLSAISLFALMSISFAGNDRWLERKWLRAVLILIPLVNILLVLTNEIHGWVWTEFIPSADNIYIFMHGPGFVWMNITTYVLVTLMFANFWLAFRRGSDLVRRQSLLLTLALLFPLAANWIYHFGVGGIEGVDWSAVTFSVSGIVILYALYGMRLLDIVHIARDIVLEQMNDGMVVLDDQDRLADFNATAQSIFGISRRDIWKSFKETPLAHLPEVAALLGSNADQITQEISIGERFFDLRLTVLMDRRGGRYGQLLVLRDVSARKQAELNLQASEAQNRAIVNSVPDLLFRINRQGVFLDFHSRDASTFYVPPEVFLNQPLANILPADVAQRARHAIEQALDSNQMTMFEYALEVGSEVRYYEDRVTPLDADVVLSVIRDITERKRAEKDVEQRLAEIQRLHQELQESQAQVVEQQRMLARVEERQQLARDLHDSVNQSIHSLMLFSETLVVLLRKDKTREALEVAERIQYSGQQALKEIRLLLYKAQSAEIGQNTDLIGTLKDRLNMVERRVGIKTEIIHPNDLEARCPISWNENLYWIIMEALNNSLKYAQAKRLTIRFDCANGRFELEIADDGIGFDPQQMRLGGFGMKSMYERAKLLGGSLSIDSSPGAGTRVHFTAEMEQQA